MSLFVFPRRMELEYDVRNRIASQKITLGRTKIQNTMTYSADGHLFEVAGSSDWKYIYDENGNIIGAMDYGQKLTLGYDVGDRVVQVSYGVAVVLRTNADEFSIRTCNYCKCLRIRISLKTRMFIVIRWPTFNSTATTHAVLYPKEEKRT